MDHDLIRLAAIQKQMRARVGGSRLLKHCAEELQRWQRM
jgi:hypothetical protein